MKRRRAIKEYDYYGVAAIGDVQYDDGFDKWEEIQEAFKLNKEIPIKRTHDDVRNVGSIKYWDLDKANKKVYIGFDKEDVDQDIKFDTINQVSIEYETIDDKIVGVNHVAIGNLFKPKCKKEVCNVMQRSEKPEGETETPAVPDEVKDPAPEEQEKSEDTEVKEQLKLLQKQVEDLSKPPVKAEEQKPDVEEDKKNDKITLKVREQVKHELPSDENKPKLGFTPWGGILNNKKKG